MKNMKPSTTLNSYWIYAEAKGLSSNTIDYNYLGKWLIFVDVKQVDEVWKKIKKATEQGKLGPLSKVSTAIPTAYNPNRKVICVYTADYRDQSDVFKVREVLSTLGFVDTLNYKTDAATKQGIYNSPTEFLYSK